MADDLPISPAPTPVPSPDPAPVASAPAPAPASLDIEPGAASEPAPAAPADSQVAPADVADGQIKQSKTPKWAQDRIDTVTKARRNAERERDALRAELEAMKSSATPPPDGEPADGQTQTIPVKDVQQLIQQEAARLVAERTYQGTLQNLAKKGQEEFNDFTERCNLLADLGASEKPEFMQAVISMEDGHKVLATLADNPEDAARVIGLPPMAMAMELAKISARLSAPAAPAAPTAPKPVSSAPKPITPIGGSAAPNDDPRSDMNDAEWFAARAKQRAAKNKQQGARF